MRSTKKHNSQIPSLTHKTLTKPNPYISNNITCNFKHIPLNCTICRSYCIAAQLATNNDVTIFKVLLFICVGTTKGLRLPRRAHVTDRSQSTQRTSPVPHTTQLR
jgi:hypothetical protein